MPALTVATTQVNQLMDQMKNVHNIEKLQSANGQVDLGALTSQLERL